MTKSSGDRDSGHWREVCGIFALLFFLSLRSICGSRLFRISSASARSSNSRVTAASIDLAEVSTLVLSSTPQSIFKRGRGVPDNPWVGNNETWKDFDDALAMPSGDLRISPNIDPEGQYNVQLAVDQLPAIQGPLENIDADNAAAAEADLGIWLAVAEVASLPRQIERDEANMMVRHPQVPSSVAESGVAASSSVDDVAARVAAPQHLPPQSPVPETVAADAPAPEVGGILAGILPQRIEAHAEAQVEVAIEASPPGMLELISDVARLPQFATASMAVPAGDLESNLEERIPVDHTEAGDSAPDLQAEINVQDGVENLEVGEPHAKGMQ